MKGTIAIANIELGRYAVFTEYGEYTIFELIEGSSLNAGDVVTGELNHIGHIALRDTGGLELAVQVVDVHCSRAIAANWAAGN